MKKVALIGVTGYGRTHLNNLISLADAGKVEISAAVVICPEVAANELELLKKYQTRIYPNTDVMFAAERGKIDLVAMPVGIAYHAPLTCQAMEAGMNVLVEKPAAGSVAEVQRMIDAQRKGLFTAVGFQQCYMPDTHFLKRILLLNRLGRILRSRTIGVKPRDDRYYSRNNWAAHRTSPEGVTVLDSPINNAFAHYLNVLLFLNGETETKTARAVSVKGELLRARPDIEMFDACHATYTLENGTEAEIWFAHCVDRALDTCYHIDCERGAIDLKGSIWRVTDADQNLIATGTLPSRSFDMYHQILRKLDDPSLPIYSLENALEHTRCIELLDQTCAIQNIPAEKRDGVYCVPGLADQFEKAYLG